MAVSCLDMPYATVDRDGSPVMAPWVLGSKMGLSCMGMGGGIMARQCLEYSLSLSPLILYLAPHFLFFSFSLVFAFSFWFWTAEFSFLHFFLLFTWVMGSCPLGWSARIGIVHDFWRGA